MYHSIRFCVLLPAATLLLLSLGGCFNNGDMEPSANGTMAKGERMPADEAPEEAAPKMRAMPKKNGDSPERSFKMAARPTPPPARMADSHEVRREAMREEAAPPPMADGHREASASPATALEDYVAKLSVDEEILKPGSGRMKVWIGLPAYLPADVEGMVSDSATVPAEGNRARVVPYAPDFDLDRSESDCIKIYPQGSEEMFTLTAKETGTFHVGVKVYLYADDHCRGEPIPRTVPEMQVTVRVNMLEPVKSSFLEQLRDWIIEIIALFFIVLTLLLRKKIKQWFGIDVKPPGE